jgi:hypothetical protein
MKRFSLALLLVSLLGCGGGGSSDPVTPPPKSTLKVASGTFDVTATMTTNGCAVSTVWDGPYEVQINSTSFSMGPWTGKWNPDTVSAVASSEKDQTTTRSCVVTRYSSIYITFYSEDTFSGSVAYRTGYGSGCSADRKPCTTSWVVRGTRQ